MENYPMLHPAGITNVEEPTPSENIIISTLRNLVGGDPIHARDFYDSKGNFIGDLKTVKEQKEKCSKDMNVDNKDIH